MTRKQNQKQNTDKEREKMDIPNNISYIDEKEADSQLDLLQEVAFDEMNLVETPFCLLQNTNKNVSMIPISPGGKEYLKIDPNSKFGLPTALAEPAVLGLMWYCQDKNGFQNETCEVNVRELVEKYMYPDKYQAYPASGQLIKAVETELWRVAFTKLYSNRWWDKEHNEHREVSFNILDINAPAKRERGKARVVRITWGKELFKSVRDRYTKNLNARLYLQIDTPLDRRFFRWLDRHLSVKETIQVKSIQRFARYKLLMQGKVIERGRRTASNYVLGKLKASLKRLDGLGFPVRMTADKTRPDFSLIFERISGETNEVMEQNQAYDLVAEFQHHFHGLPRKENRRVREADMEFAGKWIDAYGVKQSHWMVRQCKRLHSQGPRAEQKVYYFKGLEAYEMVASAAFERHQKEVAGQQKIDFNRDRDQQWEKYEARMLAKAGEQITPDKEAELRSQAEVLAREKLSEQSQTPHTDMFIAPLVAIELKNLKLRSVNSISREEFEGCETDAVLVETLRERHGYNPLQEG